MRILIVSDTYPPHVNGASHFTARLATQLAERGHTVAVIAPSDSFSNVDRDEAGVRVFRVSSMPVLLRKEFRFALPWFNSGFIHGAVHDFQPDIVHLQGHFFLSRTVLKIAREHQLPVVGTNHFMPDNLTPYVPLHAAGKKYINDWGWSDFARFFNQLDAVTTPTETAANLIRSRVTVPVTAISCGIDTAQFNPSKKRPTDTPSALFVGRLDCEKHIDEVIRAFAQVTVPATLMIAGTGSEEEKLQHLAKEVGIQDKVLFPGFVPSADLPTLYASASVFVMMGTAELQSIATLEAMASGLPVIAADAVALPELVETNVNGFLIPPHDVPALANALQKILSDADMRTRMSAASLERIQKHDITKTMQEFEALYTHALTSSKQLSKTQ